ncbi:MAG: aldo/keto reductase [Sporolactobacillus sp.]
MEYVTLNNGVKMPILGYGVFQASDDETFNGVQLALKHGYRLIDTAAAYMNEAAVGRAVKVSNVPREELFITTKLWTSDAGYDNTMRAFERSLKLLQLDYLDLLLIHQPYGDVYGSWRAMEELYKAGKIRAIGLSNFEDDRLIDLIAHNEVVPAINQVETNPFMQEIKQQQFMIDKGVQIESWGPFAEGKNGVFTNELLVKIAEKYNKGVGQVILRWLIQRGIVAIPKSVHEERIAQNIDVFDFELTSDDMKQIATMDQNVSQFFDHRDPVQVERLGTLQLKL